MDAEKMLIINDLYVNFYTPAGVVKAIDGVNLYLNKGETLGLVGETGCGKSVTANCIIKLIPVPPGKIEKGEIYMVMPSSIEKAREEMLKRKTFLNDKKDRTSAESKELSDIEHQLERSSISSMMPSNVAMKREELVGKRKALLQKGVDEKDAEVQALDKEVQELCSSYNLVFKDKKAMQKINGKYISMIFQEPMTALNPVFTAGDQIAEIILLHERKDVAETVMTNMLAANEAKKTFQKAKLTPTEKHEFKCSNCGNVVAEKVAQCPNCNAFFKSSWKRHFSGLKSGRYIRNYRRMVKDPDNRTTRWLRKIPFAHGWEKPLKKECMLRAERMLRLVRIPDPKNVIHSYPHELSGGMQQRVMIAMALACKPQVLIADEPTTALDVTIQAQILKLLKELQEETGTSILLITHNLGVVAETCDRLGVMYAGTIAEIGSKMDVFKEPLHPYTQGLLNSIPRMNVEITRLETIEGNVPNLVKPPPGCRFHPRCPFAMEVCKSVKPPMQEIRPNHFAACHLYGEVKLNG